MTKAKPKDKALEPITLDMIRSLKGWNRVEAMHNYREWQAKVRKQDLDQYKKENNRVRYFLYRNANKKWRDVNKERVKERQRIYFRERYAEDSEFRNRVLKNKKKYYYKKKLKKIIKKQEQEMKK